MTTQISNGSKIKETILENDLKLEQQKTLSTIQRFLSKHESYTDSIAWHLHCYCRTGNGDNYGYKRSEFEDTVWFLDNLIKTFMHPKAVKLFCKINDVPPSTLINFLPRLKKLFEDLQYSEVTEARLDEIEVGYFDNKHDLKALSNTQLVYQRHDEMLSTKQDIIGKYSRKFKH